MKENNNYGPQSHYMQCVENKKKTKKRGQGSNTGRLRNRKARYDLSHGHVTLEQALKNYLSIYGEALAKSNFTL
jgi:hypothetical protein